MNKFSKIRESMELKENKVLKEDEIKTLKNFVLLKEGLDTYDIVKMVLFKNGHSIDKEYVEKFKLFGYLNEGEKFTEKGLDFIESEDVIKTLKEIVK